MRERGHQSYLPVLETLSGPDWIAMEPSRILRAAARPLPTAPPTRRPASASACTCPWTKPSEGIVGQIRSKTQLVVRKQRVVNSHAQRYVNMGTRFHMIDNPKHASRG